MSFLSFGFALFVGFGLLAFHLSPARWRPDVLLGLSYAFYASWSPGYATLLLFLTVAVYFTARLIERCRTERGKFGLTVLAVTGLLVVLFTFKCATVLMSTFHTLFRQKGGDWAMLVIAPLGLSYYLFKTLGYLLDVYWEKIPAEHSFVSLALYVSFFPQIVSGPIMRADDFFSQFGKLRSFDPAEFVVGLRRILFGLFKKVVIADRFAGLVASVHSNPSKFSSLELLLGAYCYSLQLYADFSGITDIAIGTGQLFGIKGPENFDLPYFARNVQDFWRRWHMSLTSWLTDYLFMPLRMSLRSLGKVGLSLAIFVNMLAVGVWHGPKWTYAAFGAINGVFMIVSVLTLKKRNAFFQSRPRQAQLRRLVGPLLTFHLMVFAQIFFRAYSFRSALTYVARLLPSLHHTGIPAFRLDWSLLGISSRGLLISLVFVIVMEAINWAMRQRYWIDRFDSAPRFVRWGLYYAGITLLFLGFHVTVPFIYAQF
jgi:D-alanyl-lipoteichoic acid acyltransferase DltB (MBOAT superfamily)